MKTTTSVLSEDLQEISNTAAINTELKRLQVDIATLQETHLANSCFLPKKGLHICLAGKGSRWTQGAQFGFAIKNSSMKVIDPHPPSPHFQGAYQSHQYVCCYPQHFTREKGWVRRGIPSQKQPLLLGDFNARVGADHDCWLPTFYGYGRVNENGQKLLKYAHFESYASCTPSSRWNSSTRCPGGIPRPSTGFSWIWSSQDIATSVAFFLHAPDTVPTVTQTDWFAARSDSS